ncbi:MAG: alpha/beta fold hydrolase [Bacteroidia bacterium]|nr:alpha/beta fold hydrolase [Bacteroidia bacterium]MBP7244992.1 alpha/beta fold hydrolase [Bacteroidia bacterium]
MKNLKSRGSNLFIDVNDIKVCYDDCGKGEIPIIFIHGFPFDKLMWQPQLDLFGKNYRVIAYDIRGFGKSTIGSAQGSINLFADDLVKFMDGLEIKKAIVCGLSMGGYILLNAIIRYPQRFDAIILSDTQCIADSFEAKEKRKKAISQIVAGKINDFALGFIANIFSDETKKTKGDVVEKIKRTILSTRAEAVTATLSVLAERQDLCSSISQIEVPTLIICGEQDIVTPVEQAEFLHDTIPNSQLKIIENAGHMSNLEKPDEFNMHIVEFLSGIAK